MALQEVTQPNPLTTLHRLQHMLSPAPSSRSGLPGTERRPFPHSPAHGRWYGGRVAVTAATSGARLASPTAWSPPTTSSASSACRARADREAQGGSLQHVAVRVATLTSTARRLRRRLWASAAAAMAIAAAARAGATALVAERRAGGLTATLGEAEGAQPCLCVWRSLCTKKTL